MNKTFRFLMILWIGIVLDPLGLLAIASADDVPSADEILEMEKRIIETRKAIRSGRVVVVTRLTKFTQNPSQENVAKRYETYLKDDNIRADRSVGENRSQTIVTPDTMIRGFSDQSPVQVFGPETRPKIPQEVPDPRRLGIVNWFYDTLNSHGYEEILLNPNRDQFKVEAGTDAGEPVCKVQFRFSEGNSLRQPKFGEYWLSESKGGMPVYIGIRVGEGEEQRTRSIKVELKEYESGRAWFPTQVILRFTEGGNVTTEEITTVEEAVFEEDIPDDTFGIAGMGLPKGEIIDFDGKLATWDGQHVVRQDEDGNLQLDGAPAIGRRLLLFAISIVLAVLAGLLLSMRAKKKRLG